MKKLIIDIKKEQKSIKKLLKNQVSVAYMMGRYNAFESVLSTLEKRNPKFIDYYPKG